MIRCAAGSLIWLAVWQFALRRGAGAGLWPGRNRLAAALDIAPALIGYAIALLALARPLLAGLVVAALAGGLTLIDQVKRIVLHEPVVFADRAELLEIARHPRLYLPFAGSAFVLGGAAAVIALLVVTAAWLEPPLWRRTVAEATLETVAAGLIGAGAFHITSANPTLLSRAARLYTTRLTPTRDPASDSARLGPLATLVVHATIAAAERPGRQAAAQARATAPAFRPGRGPIILVQAESFMDPARLHPDLADLLPHFAQTAEQRGRLDVPAWGANTVRSEFAVLAGLPEPALGLDSFNPYDRFVGTTPLPSLPHAARAAGYRTVFVHPFDLTFYGRNRVLPRLGFDELVGIRAFRGAPRRGPYVADEAIAPVVADLLHRHGPQLFIAVATMEAHGPWPSGPAAPLPQAMNGVPEADQISRWLWHLQGTDRLLGQLQALLAEAGSGQLVLYGDHQPSFPAAFAALGLADRRTDYAVWQPDRAADRRVDLAAHELAAAMATIQARLARVTA